MKNQSYGKNLIYIHMNQMDHFVLSYGIDFPEFIEGIPEKPANLLLLRHTFTDCFFNMHTLLDYVASEGINKLASGDTRLGEFCWIDFEDEDDLNGLNGQEIAELLYLGHVKSHLRLPFYRLLRNCFVYLAHEDGLFNKTYYKNWHDLYSMIGTVLAKKVSPRRERTLFSRWKTRPVPHIPAEVIKSFHPLMREGIVFSIEKAISDRQILEIPIWIVGDYLDYEEMIDQYEDVNHQTPAGILTLDRKSGEWRALSNQNAASV